MNQLKAFLEPVQEENIKFVVSKRFLDENKNPIEWELQYITTEEDDRLRRRFTKTAALKGRGGDKTQDFDSNGYITALVAACVVYPNLHNAELQNGYNAKGAEQLLKKMLKPGEFSACLKKVQDINGFDEGMEELVEEAKN